MLPRDVLHPEFLRAPLEQQVASIVLTFSDDEHRTASFLRMIRAGHIRLAVSPGSERTLHTLTLLGIDVSGVILLPRPPRRALTSLKAPFWRGRLQGQIASIRSSRRVRPQRVVEFTRGVQVGLVDLSQLPGLPRRWTRALLRLGVTLPASVGVSAKR